jgi:DNA-binding MarR family transcriptional regulator
MAQPDRVEALLLAQQRVAALATVLNDVAAARLGVSPTDLKCLFVLLVRPRTPRELAAELRLTPSAVTSVIDRMERAGYARRGPAPDDRRRVLVSAEVERAQRAIALYTPLFERMAEIAAGYDDAQLHLLLGYAEQSAAAMAEQIRHLEE